MWIGAINDQIWLPMGQMSDCEQCSNRLELDLISLLVNFSCKLGQIMARYDFLLARISDSEQCSNRLELDLISLFVNFSCELGQIMTRYDLLWPDEWFWLNQLQLFMWNETNNDQIYMTSYYLDKWFWAMFNSQLNLILLVNFSCELGKIITIYDLLGTKWVILSNVQTDSNFT